MDGQNHEQAAHGLHDYQEQLDLLLAENNRRLQTFTGQQDPSTFSSHPQSTHDRSQHRRHLSHGVLHNLNVPAAGASSLNSIPYHSHYDGGNVTLPPILSHAQASFRAGQDTTRPDQSRAEMSASVIPPYNIDSSSTTATHGLHSQYIGSGHPASGLYMPPTDHTDTYPRSQRDPHGSFGSSPGHVGSAYHGSWAGVHGLPGPGSISLPPITRTAGEASSTDLGSDRIMGSESVAQAGEGTSAPSNAPERRSTIVMRLVTRGDGRDSVVKVYPGEPCTPDGRFYTNEETTQAELAHDMQLAERIGQAYSPWFGRARSSEPTLDDEDIGTMARYLSDVSSGVVSELNDCTHSRPTHFFVAPAIDIDQLNSQVGPRDEAGRWPTTVPTDAHEVVTLRPAHAVLGNRPLRTVIAW